MYTKEKRIKIINISGEKLFPYQLRVDCSAVQFMVSKHHTLQKNNLTHYYLSPFYNYLRHNFDYFIVGEEISQSNKPHWQCFCLKKTELGEKTIVAMRALIKRKFSSLDTKQPVSFKRSFAPGGLYKYVQKEGNVFCNMPNYVMQHLEELHKKRLRELGSNTYETVKNLAKWSPNMSQFVHKVIHAVRVGSLQSVPRKTVLWRVALQSNFVSEEEFAREFYGSLPTYQPNL